MKAVGTWVACVPLLLVPGVALGQENNLSLGATGGFAMFNLPDMPTGVYSTGAGTFDTNVDGFGAGATFGLSGSIGLDDIGDLDAAIGLSAFASIGHITSTAVDTFTGPGVVVIPGYTTPGTSSIVLTTSSGVGNSAGRSQVGDTNPQGGVVAIDVNQPVNGAGTVNVYGVTIAPGGNSFGYGAVVTQQGATDASAAYGAVAATDGGIFIGAGDLSGLTITTSVGQDVLYTGADVTLALSRPADDGLLLSGYAGPSYRLLAQRNTSTISVNIPEALPSTTVFPTYSMQRVEDLVSHYLGGVAGLSATTVVGENMLFTLGGEAGVFYTMDSLYGTESYSVEGGATTPVPLTTVTNANTASGSANGVAWSAKADGTLTMALSPTRQLSFSGSLEYLSRVATVTRSNNTTLAANTYVPGSDDGTLTYNAASSNMPILSFGDMWSFTGAVSFTGQF